MAKLENSKNLATLAYHALDNKKAKEIKVLDIHTLSTLTDYFVIASGSNTPQLMAMADAVEEVLHKENMPLLHREGHQSARWILLDYGDIVVHIFLEEDREFYNLDRLWIDAKELRFV